MTAKEFYGHYAKIPDGLERVIFDIYLDLDFTNDTGTYIMLMSENEEKNKEKKEKRKKKIKK